MNTRIALPVILLLLAIPGWRWLFGYPASPLDPAWELPVVEGEPGGVTVRFSGTSTVLFSDGETRWMTDGWFSRPGPLRVLFGEIEPDLDNIERGLARNEVTSLAAVIPLHSHYDHAMDAPEVARRTGAVVIGSEATANIARGWQLPEDQIRVVKDRERIRIGDFEVTFIASRHLEYADAEMVERLLLQSEIPEPLVPPASVFDYKLGKAWVLHVRHPAGNFTVVGSAGFVPGLLDGLDTDVVFLGVGGLGAQTPAYREDYWRHTVDAMRPDRIVLVHWDSLTGPLEGPLVGEVRIAGLLEDGSGDLPAYLRDRAQSDPAVPLHTLPRFGKVLLFPDPGSATP